MTLSALSELIGESSYIPPDAGQGFIIPSLNSTPKSPKGWTVWTFTDMDWLIMQGLPVKAYVRRFHCEEVEEGQRLLAECSGGGI